MSGGARLMVGKACRQNFLVESHGHTAKPVVNVSSCRGATTWQWLASTELIQHEQTATPGLFLFRGRRRCFDVFAQIFSERAFFIGHVADAR
jgi:hypothetical protein